MTPVKIYARRRRLVLSLIYASGVCGAIYYANLYLPFVARSTGHIGEVYVGLLPPITAKIFIALTIATALPKLLRLLVPHPVFEADEDGYTVLGTTKHPWSDLKSVQRNKFALNVLPFASWVTVKAGQRKKMNKQYRIDWAYLPGSADDLVDDIAACADAAEKSAASKAKPQLRRQTVATVQRTGTFADRLMPGRIETPGT